MDEVHKYPSKSSQAVTSSLACKVLNRTDLTGFQYAEAPAPAVIVLKHRGSPKTLLFVLVVRRNLALI
jgi:hypothetical protein